MQRWYEPFEGVMQHVSQPGTSPPVPLVHISQQVRALSAGSSSEWIYASVALMAHTNTTWGRAYDVYTP
jgi:hypothetical protein